MTANLLANGRFKKPRFLRVQQGYAVLWCLSCSYLLQSQGGRHSFSSSRSENFRLNKIFRGFALLHKSQATAARPFTAFSRLNVADLRVASPERVHCLGIGSFMLPDNRVLAEFPLHAREEALHDPPLSIARIIPPHLVAESVLSPYLIPSPLRAAGTISGCVSSYIHGALRFPQR